MKRKDDVFSSEERRSRIERKRGGRGGEKKDTRLRIFLFTSFILLGALEDGRGGRKGKEEHSGFSLIYKRWRRGKRRNDKEKRRED